MAFTQLLNLNAILNPVGVWGLRWAVLRVYRLHVYVSKVHVFQVVYLWSPVKLGRDEGAGLLQMHRAEPSLWLPGMQTQRSGVCVLVCVRWLCVRQRGWGRKNETNWLGNWRLLAGTPTLLWNTQLRLVISNIPACSGSSKGDEGREEGGNTAAWRQEGTGLSSSPFKLLQVSRLSQHTEMTDRI